MSKKSRKNNKAMKPKRLTPAKLKIGIVTMQVEPDLSGMPAYRSKPPRRHHGPITAGAIPGTSNRRHSGGKKG